MKLMMVLTFVFSMQASATVFSQTINLSVEKQLIEKVMQEIRRQSGYNFFLNAKSIQKAAPVTADFTDMALDEALDIVFRNQPLDYTIKGKSIIINEKPIVAATTRLQATNAPSVQRNITGTVSDSTGHVLAGATVTTNGSGTSTQTDSNGQFTLRITEEDTEITVSYVGMTAKTVPIDLAKPMRIVLRPASTVVDDVVVTGFYTRNRSSYTGSASTFSGEQLKAVAPTSIIEALSTLTPGLVTIEETASGSNPNRLPDILIRGITSLATNDQTVNQPLIVRDGTIISLQDLYDMDINEIESVTVLKDASAAALYGAKAANGVIVIERKPIQEGRLRVAYSQIGSVQFPDFSDYRLLNASQKLEYEQLAGLYTSDDPLTQYALDSIYNERFKEVRRGVSTDWMAQPSRVGFSLDHSIRLSGGSQRSRYELSARHGSVEGVMKEDYRKRYGIGFVLGYYTPDGLSFSNRSTYNQTDVKNTPYGGFSTYTNMNPYDRIYDEFGQLRRVLSWNTDNPLYEAQVGSYDISSSQIFSNNFDARWNINREFRVTSHWNLSLNRMDRELYTSPESGAFKDETVLSNKGRMTRFNDKGLSYSGNLVGSYNKIFADNSLLTVSLGGNINRVDHRAAGFTGIGFLSEELQFINFAASYPTGGHPDGSQDLSADVGGFMNLNYMFRNRYMVDGIYQVSGSSKFGANNRYGQFWSTGLGWNIHNEGFATRDWIDILKLRGSVGYTGKINFAPYQALTTYRFREDMIYLNGIGAVPITIGNEDLRWERTMNYNAGLDISFWQRRFNMTADVYLRLTTDLLIDRTIAPSTGTTSGKDNLGEMENRGIELRVDGYAVQNTDFSLQLGMMAAHNRNKILKISTALQRQNELNNSLQSLAPLPQFEEGESTTAIKVVRSAGIDPATGQEVFLTRTGERTFVYNPAEKIVVGDRLPVVTGNFSTSIRYKNLTVMAYVGFNYGGYVYNTTRASKVEGANPMRNADQRVFNDRWKQPGDVTFYKNIADQSMPRQTTRFVEKENTLFLQRLNLSYELSREPFVRRLGISRLSAGVSMNDLFRASTVQIERGTSYLYSRGVDFNINLVF